MAGAINPVNLTAPTPAAASSPLLTQMQQLAIQQQLAEALLGKAMDQYPTSIHTGGGNPFAVDIPNIAGPVSQVANAIFGKNKLDKVSGQQAQLSQLYQQQKQADIKSVFSALDGSDALVPTADGQPYHIPGSVTAAAEVAGKSVIPEVQDLGKSLMDAWVKGHLQSVLGGQELGQVARTSTGPSIARSVAPGPFGMELKNPGNLEPYPKVVGEGAQGLVTPLPGQDVKGAGIVAPTVQGPINPNEAIPKYSLPGAVPQPGVDAPPGASAAAAGSAAGGAVNTTGGHIGVTPAGNIDVLKTPTTTTAAATSDKYGDKLAAGKAESENFMTMLPKLVQMQQLLPNVDMRLGGEWITKARQFARSIGVSADDANKITDTLSYLKFALIPATQAGRGLTARITQMEFLKYLQAFAADQNGDPRAAANVINDMIMSGMNDYHQHQNEVAQAAKMPGMTSDTANAYLVKGFPTSEELAKQLEAAGVPFSFTTGKNLQGQGAGLMRNLLIGHTAPLAVEPGAPPPPEGAVLPLNNAPPPGSQAAPGLGKGWTVKRVN